MKGLVIICVVALLSGCGIRAKSIVDRRATIYAPNNGSICLLAGSPPSDIKYEVVGRVVATKKSYGSSEELLPAMAYEARSSALTQSSTCRRDSGSRARSRGGSRVRQETALPSRYSATRLRLIAHMRVGDSCRSHCR